MCQHGHLKEELTQAIRTPKSRAVVHLNCWYIVSMVIVYVFSLFVVRRLFCLDFYNRLDPINARRLRPQGLRGGGAKEQGNVSHGIKGTEANSF